MPLEDTVGAKTPLGSALGAGVETLSLNQSITFRKYKRVVLPIDGFVFWVRASELSTSALLNSPRSPYNLATYNKPLITTPLTSADNEIEASGSLHYSTETRQEESETYGLNKVQFTSLQEIEPLNAMQPDEIFIGSIDDIRFAFSSRGYFYQQSELWHYIGDAIYPDMETQIVDDPATLDLTHRVVSNSLPLWLGFNGYQPFYGFGNPTIPIYPSYLVPDNLRPPFISVHVQPNSTRALSAMPVYAKGSSLSQLAVDDVRVTMYGLRNDESLDFLSCVLQRSEDYDEFGIMNQPVIRDDKRIQSETSTIAQKKVIDFTVNYLQTRMNNIARQLITSAIPTFIPSDA